MSCGLLLNIIANAFALLGDLGAQPHPKTTPNLLQSGTHMHVIRVSYGYLYSRPLQEKVRKITLFQN